MKKLFVAILFFVPFVSLAQTMTADKVVAVVGNSAIFYSEVYESKLQIEERNKQQGISSGNDIFTEALETAMLNKILYQQALVDSLTINVPAIERTVEERLSNMVAQAGSTQALEQMYNMPMFSIKDKLIVTYKQMSLAQQMQFSIQSKVSVIPSEVERYYKNIDKDSLPIIPEQYRYAQITMAPASTEDAKVRVREQLLEMRKRIIDGTRFDLLARMYSVDGSARRGGEMDPTPREGFVAPFSDAMVNLKIGQVSEVVETEFGFHLIELLAKSGNLYTCRHILLRPVFSTDEIVETGKMLDDVAKRIKDGELTFAQAAEEYSDDSYSKSNGGIVSNMEMLAMYGAYDPSLASTKFITDELSPTDFRVLKNMKVGDISESFQAEDMRGNIKSKIIKLVDIIPAHRADIDNDYLKIEQMTLAAKQEKEFNNWLNEKIENIYVRINDDYKNSDFKNKAWLKK